MRELQEIARSSGGESKEMSRHQLNSVSGVRGRAIEAGRKEKLTEQQVAGQSFSVSKQPSQISITSLE